MAGRVRCAGPAHDAENLPGDKLVKGRGAGNDNDGCRTFDTFKIEQQARWLDPTDPARMWEYQIESWFAPELQHWVRRTTQIKFEKRVRENTTEELANFIKKP